VRHAHAGVRGKWVGPDRERPLSDTGWRQAEGIARLLGDLGIGRILSSPYPRCVQTVEPLGRRTGVPIEPCDEIAEGAPLHGALALARSLVGTTAVLCSHGDVLPPLLFGLADRHGPALPAEPPFAKGATWVLDEEDGRLVRARYLPPPA
jgi:phosphohistidine phosphatase SixA